MINDQQTTEFTLTYEGIAVEENTMDVKDLAPALLALGQTFERANSILNGDKAEIHLNIRATKLGSFEVALILNQLMISASQTLVPDWITSAITLRDLIIGTPLATLSLFLLIKQLKGKKPKQTETESGITFEAENVKINVPTEIARIYNDKSIRENVEVVVRPLTRAGINKVVFKDKKKTELGIIYNSEAEYFIPSEDDVKDTKEHVIPRLNLQISSLTFKEGKWLLNDGAHTNWYSMDDKEFLDEIERGKSFGKHHILICEAVLTQKMLPDGKLKMDYAVKKVIKHIIPAGRQLPFKEDSGSK